jgi:hypothetical protein
LDCIVADENKRVRDYLALNVSEKRLAPVAGGQAANVVRAHVVQKRRAVAAGNLDCIPLIERNGTSAFHRLEVFVCEGK